MDRYRLIAGIVACLIYLFAMFPVQTFVIGIVLLIAYLVLRNMPGRVGEYSARDNGKEVRRRDALDNAKMYLAPYSDIWRNLKLSNTYCSLRLQSNGYSIVGRESVYPYRSFRVTYSKIHSDSDLWDMFCNVFTYNTNFDNLIELCRTFQAEIKLEPGQEAREQKTFSSYGNYTQIDSSHEMILDTPSSAKQETRKEKLDVNNASEVEITSLPGISIVLAKKIIKRREEIGGFKDVNDFLDFTQLKPHMRMQLRDLICVNKMKGAGKIKRNNERSVDL